MKKGKGKLKVGDVVKLNSGPKTVRIIKIKADGGKGFSWLYFDDCLRFSDGSNRNYCTTMSPLIKVR